MAIAFSCFALPVAWPSSMCRLWNSVGSESERIQLACRMTSILAVLACLYPAGCGIQPPPNISPQQPNVISLAQGNWYIYYSSGTPAHPAVDPDGVWSVEFPITGHVNYVQTPYYTTTTPHNVTVVFRVESHAPVYWLADSADILPATVHVFFEQKNDDLINPDGRWWAQSSVYDLGSQDNTTITLILPLIPEQWSNVYGKHDAQSFYAALANVGWIGITCGGQNFWGHGVGLQSGTAKYVLVDFEVN